MADIMCKNCGESMWLHPEFDYCGQRRIECSDFEPIDPKQIRIPEGTKCTFIKKAIGYEEELLDYHQQYRKGLKEGMRLEIYEDYGYTSPDYIGWYFAISDIDEKFLVHMKEIETDTTYKDNSVMEWIDSMAHRV